MAYELAVLQDPNHLSWEQMKAWQQDRKRMDTSTFAREMLGVPVTKSMEAIMRLVLKENPHDRRL